MEKINCRGDRTKQEIVEKYDLTPISYVKLLNGQNKKCCCNDRLTDSYYTFSAIEKNTKKEYSFFAGISCARKFLTLLNISPLLLFNPLIIDVENYYITRKENKESKRKTILNFHPINKELLEAICLLSIVWDSPLLSMNKIVSYTRNRYSIPNIKGVYWFNEKIGNDSKGRTLTQMCDDLRINNPTLKHFKFENLKKILIENFPESMIFI